MRLAEHGVVDLDRRACDYVGHGCVGRVLETRSVGRKSATLLWAMARMGEEKERLMADRRERPSLGSSDLSWEMGGAPVRGAKRNLWGID